MTDELKPSPEAVRIANEVFGESFGYNVKLTNTAIEAAALVIDRALRPVEIDPTYPGRYLTPGMGEALDALTRPATMPGDVVESFQQGVDKWMDACFGEPIKSDSLERADRLTEEALELVQTIPGFSADRAHALVDYVFGRPVGERGQEVGGTMVCLAALCNTFGISIQEEADRELTRIWTKVEAIRAKQATKPTGSALPSGPAMQPALQAAVDALEADNDRLVSLLTKAVGDIAALLVRAGDERKIADFTGIYVEAINAQDHLRTVTEQGEGRTHD